MPKLSKYNYEKEVKNGKIYIKQNKSDKEKFIDEVRVKSNPTIKDIITLLLLILERLEE